MLEAIAHAHVLLVLNFKHEFLICENLHTFVSNQNNFLHENRAKIAQRFSYVSSKNFTTFRYNFALMRKSYFAQIRKKILVFSLFVIPAISLFRAISLCCPISLNFEKQFQEINESKVKPILVLVFTLEYDCGRTPLVTIRKYSSISNHMRLLELPN